MKSKATKPRKSQRPRTASRPPLGVYANYVRAKWGLSEISITLSQLRAEGDEWPVTEVGTVSLAPVAAKALVLELMAALSAFETVHGPIAVNPKAVQPLPASPLFTPEVIARLAILRAELFPGTVDGDGGSGNDDNLTRH